MSCETNSPRRVSTTNCPYCSFTERGKTYPFPPRMIMVGRRMECRASFRQSLGHPITPRNPEEMARHHDGALPPHTSCKSPQDTSCAFSFHYCPKYPQQSAMTTSAVLPLWERTFQAQFSCPWGVSSRSVASSRSTSRYALRVGNASYRFL